MDHTKAVSDRSAERYLLGEMPAVEAEEFEQHYFDCEECAMAVESAEVFIANTRAVLAQPEPAADRAEPAKTPRQSFWDALWAWRTGPAFALPVLATVVLGGLSFYQATVQIPALRHQLNEPRVLSAFQLMGTSRGEATAVTVPAATPWFALAADIPPDVQFPRYMCHLSLGGRELFSLPAPAPAAGKPITILVPAQDLRPGTYELVIQGVDAEGRQRDRVSSSTFSLEFR